MKIFKRSISVTLVMLIIISLSFTTMVFGESEKRIDVDYSDGCYVTVSNMENESTVYRIEDNYLDDSIVYMPYITVKSPSVVKFINGDTEKWESVLSFEDVFYLPNGKIENEQLIFGEGYDIIVFDVKDEKEVSEEGPPTYSSGNYATLTKPGLYYISASPEAVESTIFVVNVEGDSDNSINDEMDVEQEEILSAFPTASKVLVDGSEVSFDAYNINGNNYFKLRDLAMVLNGSKKQFEIGWDWNNNAINLTTESPYTIFGGELDKSLEQTVKEAMTTTSKLLLNGKEIKLTAYNILGNNYFKLRDIGKIINFGVTWNGETNTIGIDTSIEYTE